MLTTNQRNTLAMVRSWNLRGWGCTSFELRESFPQLTNSASAARLKALRDKGLIDYGGRRRHPGSHESPHMITAAGREELIGG